VQNKTFIFKLSDDGYYKLLKFMPYFRKVYFFGIIGLFVISIALFLYWNHSFQELASSLSQNSKASFFISSFENFLMVLTFKPTSSSAEFHFPNFPLYNVALGTVLSSLNSLYVGVRPIDAAYSFNIFRASFENFLLASYIPTLG
jgi:hypothetical protein